MDKAFKAIKLVIDQWNDIQKLHPNDKDFSAFGINGLQASDFDQMFGKWEKVLEDFSNNTSFDSTPEIYSVDNYLEQVLLLIKGVLETNKPAGFADILTKSNFFQWISEATLLMNSVADIRLNLLKDLEKSATSKVGAFASLMKDAAINAKKLTAPSLNTKVKTVETALSKAEENLIKVTKIKGEADTLDKDIKLYGTALSTTKKEVDEIVANLQTINKTTTSTLELITKEKDQLLKDISASQESVKTANKSVSEALVDINRKGLSGSFVTQANKITSEKNVWLGAFIFSIVTLMGIASLTVYGTFIREVLAKHLDVIPSALPITTTVKGTVLLPTPISSNIIDWKDLWRELPFAAPLIWLGWLSARQVGVLSKIQQDYNYKASTAVAFEGYKKEIASAQDPALSQKLLEISIQNFGENPIRLYSGKDDHGMPIEELLAKLFDEKTFDKWLPQFQKICEAIGRVKPGSS